MIVEIGDIAYGNRPGLAATYRVCQRCHTQRATHYIKHSRKWGIFPGRTELVCDACLPSHTATLTVKADVGT
jgi:hypothetical protein